MQRIAVIDYGMGNLRSVAKAVEQVAPDDEVVVTNDATMLASADRLICPGQGAAADCMAALNAASLAAQIKDMVGTKPFLGICMGLQVLLTESEENNGVSCINVVPGFVKRFDNPLLDEHQVRLKVPHMGWSKVQQRNNSKMWQGIDDNARFYFAHSYYCEPDDPAQIAAVCHYGHTFAVAVQQKNLFACQFHPEKSANDGLQLLKNFTQWDGEPC